MNSQNCMFFYYIFAATTPAIVGVCLGATLFLVGIISVTLFLFRRKSTGYRKSGVYLTSRSPNSEDFPLQSQLIIPRKTSGDSQSHYVRTPHLVMKKSPSPPFYPSPSPRTSPLTPPTDDSEGGVRGGHNPRSIAIRSNPQAEEYAEIHGSTLTSSSSGAGRGSRGRSPHLVSTSYGTTTSMSSPSMHAVYHSHLPPTTAGGSNRPAARSPRTSPQTSPTTANASSCITNPEMLNQRNGNTMMESTSSAGGGGAGGSGIGSSGAGCGGVNNMETSTSVAVESSSKGASPNNDSTNATSSTVAVPPLASQSLSGGGEFGLGSLFFKMR